MATTDMESFGLSTNVADYSYMTLSTANGSTWSISSNGAFGDPFAVINGDYGNNGGLTRYLPSVATAGFLGARAKNAGSLLWSVADSVGNSQLTLRIDGDGTLYVSRGRDSGYGGALLYTAPLPVLTAGWRYVEFGFVIDAAAGSFNVQVDGVQFAAQSGLNTKGSSAAATVGRLFLSGRHSLAHLYFNDTAGPAPNNGFLGDVRVVNAVPNGAGASTQFAPVGNASNYLNAATVPPSPATKHNDSSTVGALDLFTTGGVVPAMGTIYGVQVKTQMSKNDAGNRTMANVLQSGGTQVAGATTAVAVASQFMRDTFNTDPATGAAWTRAGLNAAQIGYKVVA